MSGKKIDWYKKLSGRTEDEDFRFPTADESFEQAWKQSSSKYPLRLLGVGQEEVYISEEERASHMHIIGTTGVGKSYFLLRQMQEDIDRGNGFCFLDPSFNGNTMRMVLSYCAKVGFKKVLVIDPHREDRIPPLDLFKHKKQNSIEQIYSTVRVLFDMRNQAQYSFIENYLPALVGVLYNSGRTLYESLYFSDYDNPIYREIREDILYLSAKKVAEEKAQFDPDGIVIQGAFKNPTRYENFGSTIRRLSPFYKHDTLKLMFGSKERIKFASLIADGWVILVNLHRGNGISGMNAKLLGTAVINEVIYAIQSLRTPKKKKDGTTRNPWRGRYYLYIDEAGEFANDKLIDLLYYHRQAGLAVILAHQINAQFSTPEIKEAVQGLTRIKVAFYQTSPNDRLETAKALYGGDVKDRDAEFALKKLRQQHAVIMTDDRQPRFVMIPDTFGNIDVPDSFLEEIYRQDFYQDATKIIKEQQERGRVTTYHTERASKSQEPRSRNDTSRTSTSSSKKGAAPNKKSTGKAASSKRPDLEDLIKSLREDTGTGKKDDPQ